MSSNYFEKLKLQAHQLDHGIEKLIKIWKLPQLLVGGFAECTKETDIRVEEIWSTIKNTKDGIEEVLAEVKNGKANENGTLNMEQFLQECKADYDNLKMQCENLDIVLAEYGYRYNDSNTLEQTIVNNGKES